MKFYFNKNLPVNIYIDNIKNGKIVKDEVLEIVKNFVKKDQLIIELEDEKETVNFTGSFYFNQDKKKLYAPFQGYICFSNEIKIYPLYIISNDNMKLYLLLPYNVNDVDYDQLKSELLSLNIFNFNPDILKEYRKPGFYTIHKGKYPKDGHCEKIYLLIDDKVIPGLIDEYGNIDYFERKFLVPVKKGDTIAKIEQELQPEDGNDLFGKLIPAKYDNKPLYLLGKNVSRAEGFVIADCDGILSIKENKINVIDFVKIKGDISIASGNIHSNSSVIVDGNILENIEVEINGDFYVLGGIYSPKSLTINGNLYLRKGIVGRIDSIYNIEGDLFCQYIENCYIKVKGNIIVEREIIMSSVLSNKNIIVTKKEGEILSSKITFYQKLFVNSCGKESGGKNEIIMGYSYVIEDLLKDVKKKEDELLKNKSKYNENEFYLKMNIINDYRNKLVNNLYNLKSKIFLFDKMYYDNVIYFYKGKFCADEIIEKKIFVLDVDLKLKLANFLETIRKQILEYCEKFYKISEKISKLESKELETKYVKERKREHNREDFK
ncbi:MAG: FapA family protein [Spirochaetes bacterium]|nr:FapA family protein [Spirochaetota bacterium]